MFSHHVNNGPLPEYAANLLVAIRDLDMVSNGSLFVALVIRSCLPMIAHRLSADLYSFIHPLEDILDGWSPGRDDTLAPKQVPAHKVYSAFLLPHLTSAQVVGKEDKYEWCINTASIWISALCHVIKKTKRFAAICRNHSNNIINSNALHNLTHALVALHFLSHCVPILSLLSLPFIQSRLRRDRMYRVEDSVCDDGELTLFQ